MDLWGGLHYHQHCASVLEVEKECDKDANEIIGRRIQFSEIILISISEMIERMVANKETKKKAEEEIALPPIKILVQMDLSPVLCKCTRGGERV